MEKKVQKKQVSVKRMVKDLFHPSCVSWKSAKSTTHDAAIVLGVVIASAALLAIGDGVFGFVIGLAL